MFKLLSDAELISDQISNGDVKKLLGMDQKTLLLIASWLGKTEIVKILLQNGADLSAEDEAGR